MDGELRPRAIHGDCWVDDGRMGRPNRASPALTHGDQMHAAGQEQQRGRALEAKSLEDSVRHALRKLQGACGPVGVIQEQAGSRVWRATGKARSS